MTFMRDLPKPIVCILSMALLAGSWAVSAFAEAVMLPVPTVTLYPGDPLSPQTIGEKKFSASAAVLRNYATSPDMLFGKSAKRTLVAGKPILLSMIQLPATVRQGALTRAEFSAGGLMIATRLIPLHDGAAGEFVSARNPDTGLVVQAMVRNDGTLQVSAP